MRRPDLTSVLILLLALVAISSHDIKAQEQDNVKKDSAKKENFNYYIYTGAFLSQVSTELRVDSKDGILGTTINLEDDLNFDSSPEVFRTDVLARITRRSSFSFSYFSISRSRERTLDKDITINDTVYNIGASVSLKSKIQYFALDYRYSAIKKENWDAGFVVGTRWLNLASEFRATLNQYERQQNVNFGVPVLLIGLHGSAYIIPRLQGRYLLEYFGLTIEGIKGTVLENRFSLEYYILKNVGLGAAINFISYNVKDFPLSNKFQGKFKYGLNGASLYLAGRF